MPEEPPSRRCELAGTVDLERVFTERDIEHLRVDDDRTFVLYGEGILKLIVSDGTLTAARTLTVECIETSHLTTDPDPQELLTSLCEVITMNE